MTLPPESRAPSATPAPPRQSSRPVDASMDLLLQVLRVPVDPDYAVVAARGDAGPRRHWALAGVALAVGALFSVAALQTTRAAPDLQSERRELITRVQAAETEQDQLRSRATVLSDDITTLRAAALGDDASSQTLQRRVNQLAPLVGDTAVHGPGVQIVVDDAAAGTDERDRVLDLDLQILANGLWQSGAEAVAVNGHRLSNLTAIRNAGDAITVDYRSLTRPYRVEAIGDPRTLPAALAESSAGAWWHDLASNRGMRFEVGPVDDLALPADPGLMLRWAKGTS